MQISVHCLKALVHALTTTRQQTHIPAIAPWKAPFWSGETAHHVFRGDHIYLRASTLTIGMSQLPYTTLQLM
jgi:hypothetical protein